MCTPCYCIILWFWITSHYIVTLPEVCHYGSSVSVGKWICCGTVDFNFPCLQLSLSNLQPASIILLPPRGSVWQPEKNISLISSGLYGAHLPLISKPLMCKYIGDWPVTFLINWQVRLVSSLLLSGSLDLRGLGQGLVAYVLFFLSDLHDPLPLNEGEQGWEMRHFRAQGFIPAAQWITLQRTKRRRYSFFFFFKRNPLPWTLFQTRSQ